MINYISSYINQNTLIELRDMPYDAIHTQSDDGLGIYIRNAYLSLNSKLREENYKDICDAIIEKLSSTSWEPLISVLASYQISFF